MKRTTTLTVINQVPRNYHKGYQVPGIKKEKRRKEKKYIDIYMENETKTNTHALKEHTEPGGDNVAVCW